MSTSQAYAGIVKCVDNSGRVEFRKAPCPSNTESSTVDGLVPEPNNLTDTIKQPQNDKFPSDNSLSIDKKSNNLYEETLYRCGVLTHTVTVIGGIKSQQTVNTRAMNEINKMGGPLSAAYQLRDNKKKNEFDRKIKGPGEKLNPDKNLDMLLQQGKCKLVRKKTLPAFQCDKCLVVKLGKNYQVECSERNRSTSCSNCNTSTENPTLRSAIMQQILGQCEALN